MTKLILLLMLPLSLTAQYSRKDIFNKNVPIVWLGVDFSRARIEGYKFSDDQFKEVFFPDWNEMLRNTSINKYLHRREVDVDISEVNRLNASIVRNLRVSASLEKDSVIGAISWYNLPDKQAIGVVLFVSDIIHKGEHLYGKIAFIDLRTGDLLMLKKFKGEGRGFGFYNTWANAIKSALGYIRRKWNNWERE